ncbi:hypothetical protein C8J57DRAFT_1732811 [Mycena rebaudengoi]|nr:hypothetical protein C8J57DRAFT_1732811 [Mycena rebaudengoi]
MQVFRAAACVAALTKKFPSPIEMIHTLSGRSSLVAVLCICCAQTFAEGSSDAIAFVPAFAAALDAYVGSSTEAAIAAEIREITDPTEPPKTASPLFPKHTSTSTWFRPSAWLKKGSKEERKEREEREERNRQVKALTGILKTHCLRFHEERKAQIERANSL